MAHRNPGGLNTVAIIQARTGSTRLPNKVLKEISGKTVLVHGLCRVKEMKLIDKIVVATTATGDDDMIVRAVDEYDKNIGIFRGSDIDVLDRYYNAAKTYNADVIVRITSDCPLIDPKISDGVVKAFLESDCDYCCNNMPRTYPHGLDTEVFSFDALEKAWRDAKTPYDKEHVTPYIRGSGIFKTINVKNSVDLSKYRWTLDYPEDLEFVTEIYKNLYTTNNNFDMYDIIRVIEKYPWIVNINHIHAAR